MRIWISKNSEVPVREQIVAQMTLAIASGEYRQGQKLPSTSELARRGQLHPNTVRSAYQQLADQKLVEYRKGSGFYVSDSANGKIAVSQKLEQLINDFFAAAMELGFDRPAVLQRLKRKTNVENRSTRVVLIEPDRELRQILARELGTIISPLESVESLAEHRSSRHGRSRIVFTAMFDEKSKLDPLLRDDETCIYLHGRSVAAALAGEARPRGNESIAVVSGWRGFLDFARIVLLAARIEPGNLIIRSTADDDWQRSVSGTSMTICDVLTAEAIGDQAGVRPFRIISDESLVELGAVLRMPS